MYNPENQYNNPWQTLSVETKYNNPWIQVDEHQVINPAGNNGIYGVVHFKNLAIGIVPLEIENGIPYIYMVGQFRYPLHEYSWEIPEGGGNLSVSPLESAQRELAEETGLRADYWELIIEMRLSNSVSDEKGYIFLASQLSQGNAHPEETEQLNVKRISLQEAYHQVKNFEITDSLSISGILQTYILWKENKLL